MSAHACNAASRGYTMEKARPAVIARVLASSATPPAGRARILHRLMKLVISEATLTAPGHGRARPEQKHTPAKASYAGSGESLRYLGGRLPALFAIKCLYFMFGVTEPILRIHYKAAARFCVCVFLLTPNINDAPRKNSPPKLSTKARKPQGWMECVALFY